MDWNHSNTSARGFTLIELLVVIAIIGLLSSVILASLNAARSKARFANAFETMENMGKAAAMDYDDNGNYAPDLGPGAAPRFVPQYLSSWPTPPCTGWTYDWENWTGGSIVRVTLRRADVTPIYYYCIYSSGDCSASSGTDIRTVTNRTLTCNE